MPPLKHVKHEQFVQTLVTSPSATKAYQETYQNPNSESSKVNASKLLTIHNVRERLYELLEKRKVGLERVTERFGEVLNDTSEKALSWDAVKTGFKLYGLFSDDQKNQGNISNLQFNIQIGT